MGVQYISAVTFAVRDMDRSVDFYERCGFHVVYGGRDAAFTSLQSGEAYVKLIGTAGYASTRWGRAIFRVADADEQYRAMTAASLRPDAPPQDAAWGERYFHITDPDGHELSFAQLITR